MPLTSGPRTCITEKALRALLKPGQRRIHFKSERDSRRREILSRMNELDVRVAVWIVKDLPNKESRDLCIAGVAAAACRSRADQLFLERDDSLMIADRKLIASILRQEKNTNLKYQHAAPHEYPLLWVSDAVAWRYLSGGDWTRRVEPLVEHQFVRLLGREGP